ncbi:NAD-dependent epimerase/dehydratase family protein, partial [Thermoflexus hugenholtzii]
SHLVEAGRQAGWEIRVVDDLSRGSPAHLPEDVPLIRMDIRDPALEDLVADFRPAVIHHLAAQVDVAASVADPWHDASVNLLGTLRVLRAALRGGARRVVLASSAAVYGEPERLPVAEGHPLRPLSPYGLSKATAEAYARWFGAHHGLEVTILRYGNVYGPRQPVVGEAGVIARFLAALADGERPVIHGDGRQVRDFIYVGDVAAAHLQATARGAGGIYNIGTGRAISIRGLYRLMQRVTGVEGEPTHGPPRPGDIRRMVLDIRRAQAELGWRPQVALLEGLARTWVWWKAQANRSSEG